MVQGWQLAAGLGVESHSNFVVLFDVVGVSLAGGVGCGFAQGDRERNSGNLGELGGIWGDRTLFRHYFFTVDRVLWQHLLFLVLHRHHRAVYQRRISNAVDYLAGLSLG